jgi:hypothetical protein
LFVVEWWSSGGWPVVVASGNSLCLFK